MNITKHLRTALALVLLIPLLVAAVGIWALKDRVDGLANVPAAVVNLDKGADVDVDGKTQHVPFGRLLAGGLTQPATVENAASDSPTTNGFNWQLTTKDDAEKGLKSGKYSAVVVIPEDFSANLATAGTKDAKQATLIVNTNEASGLIDSAVGEAITQAVTTSFNNTMAEKYLNGIYLGFNSLHDGFTQSADGAEKLNTGVSDLSSGAHSLSDGAGQLATGVDQLKSGTTQLADGAQQLSSGTSQLADGSSSLASGSNALADGTEQLSSGLTKLSSGADSVADGAEQLNAGINGTSSKAGLLQGANQLAQGVEGDSSAQNPGLVAGSKQLADGLSTYSNSLPDAQKGLTSGLQSGVTAVFNTGQNGNPSFAQSVDSLASGCAKTKALFAGDPRQAALDPLCSGLDQLNTQGVPGVQQAIKDQVIPTAVDTAFQGDGTAQNPGLIGGAKALADGAQASAASAPQLVAGITQLRDGIKQVGDGAAKLAPGARQVANGLDASAGGSADLNSGAEQLASGADQLNTGVSSLDTGAQGLAEGTSSLNSGVSDLSTGADQLAQGTSDLATGTDSLKDGSTQLANGLRDAANNVPTYSESERANLAKTSTQSVTLDSVRSNSTDSGSVAAFPFVAGLGLWIGAFAMFLVLPALRRRYLDSAMGMWRVVLRSLAPIVAIAAIQAVLVLALVVVLGISVANLLSAGLIAIAAALTFVIVHQMLIVVFGPRNGRIVALILTVLQIVVLAGILPLESAPAALQTIGSVMPLTIASQGLMHAALGGAVTSTASTIVGLLLISAISLALSFVFARTARLKRARRQAAELSAEVA